MLNNLNQQERDDLTGHIFIGTVVANDDPAQLERIKVGIPNMFEGADYSLYPWMGKASGGNLASATGSGSFGLVPTVGSKVFVNFQHGDPHYPMYWCAPILSGYRPAEANVNYPFRYGWKDPAGNLVYIDTKPGSVQMVLQHKSGSWIKIEDNGAISFKSVATMDLESAGQMTLKAPQIHLNPD